MKLIAISLYGLLTILSTNCYAIGYYQRSGDGSYEWVDTIKSNISCTTSRGGVSTLVNGNCVENTPDTQWVDPEYRMMADYLSDLGHAAVVAAENSKYADSINIESTNLDNQSSSNSNANSYSNSNSQATARSRAIQSQLQNQRQHYEQNKYGGRRNR